jgi:hypothetical protein
MYKSNILPMRLTIFLNEMANRFLVETDGATWRFRHRILQDYFTEQWVESAENLEHISNPNE